MSIMGGKFGKKSQKKKKIATLILCVLLSFTLSFPNFNDFGESGCLGVIYDRHD